MVTTIVYVTVKPDCIEAFHQASLANSQQSVKEIGNIRFDVLQSLEHPCQFVLYEAYETKEQAAAHKNTPHYALWRDTVAPMMAEPRKGVGYEMINTGFTS